MGASVYYTVIASYHSDLVITTRPALLRLTMNMQALQFFAEGLSIHLYLPEEKSSPKVLKCENVSGIDKYPSENKTVVN